MNIVQTIRQETQSHAARIAMVEDDRAITYSDLLTRIALLGRELSRRGIRAGQRIAFRSSDGIDYVIGALALLECGAAVVPVADSLTPAEIEETIDRIDVHGILNHQKMSQQTGDDATGAIDDTFRLRLRSASTNLESECRDMGAAFIRFSSGTTGESKGVVLSHQSIIDRTDAANQGLAITDRDVILWVLGMSHHFVVSILLFLRKGATIIVANQNFPFSVLDAAQNHPITFIYGSPVHYYLLSVSDSVSPTSLAGVRMAISTSMKMPPEIFAQFTTKFGLPPREAYGIIEIGLPFINTDNNAGQNTVGRILPDYQLRIANPDEHGVGEVLIKGKGMFDAYFSPWRTREQVLADGWFDTGDLGRVDDRGRLALLGRSKTVLVCAGMKVFPEEVEETINSLPSVKMSLVSGRDHPQYGQVPVAQLVLAGNAPPAVDPQDSLAEIRAHCFKQLSSYKVPVDFQIVDSLPKTPSGKLIRAGR